MPRNPPPEHTRWRKGQSGNLSGKPKGILTRDQVQACMGRMTEMNSEELQAVIENKKSTMLEVMVASIMMQAAKLGDPGRMEFLLQRTIGKVAETIKHGLDKSLHLQLMEAMEKHQKIEGGSDT